MPETKPFDLTPERVASLTPLIDASQLAYFGMLKARAENAGYTKKVKKATDAWYTSIVARDEALKSIALPEEPRGQTLRRYYDALMAINQDELARVARRKSRRS